MPRLTGNRLPKYGKHKVSGQAVVKLDGRDVYLGPWNSQASKLEYDRVVGEWISNGRALPAAKQLTVVKLCARYKTWAAGYYVKNGQPTGTTDGIKVALRVLCKAYGRTPAADFGPLALAALQAKMVELDSPLQRNEGYGAVTRSSFPFGRAPQNAAKRWSCAMGGETSPT